MSKLWGLAMPKHNFRFWPCKCPQKILWSRCRSYLQCIKVRHTHRLCLVNWILAKSCCKIETYEYIKNSLDLHESIDTLIMSLWCDYFKGLKKILKNKIEKWSIFGLYVTLKVDGSQHEKKVSFLFLKFGFNDFLTHLKLS